MSKHRNLAEFCCSEKCIHSQKTHKNIAKPAIQTEKREGQIAFKKGDNRNSQFYARVVTKCFLIVPILRPYWCSLLNFLCANTELFEARVMR